VEQVAGGASEAAAADPLIAVEGLHKRFGSAPALRGVGFDVAASQLTVVIGASGCGKSTLLRCLNGLESFDAGRIRIGDVVLEPEQHLPARERSSRLSRLRGEVGMVFQGFHLFPHMSVLDNVAKAPRVVLGLGREEAEARARALLDKVGLADRTDYPPARLSGGQQQRAAIARALAMSPRVMLYDEPTSALDPGLVGEVLATMRRLDDEGMTQIVVTHEMRFAREAADQVLFLHDGVLVEAGPPDRLFEAPRDPRTRAFLGSVR
jgi:ABC-type polar amino acid transport system ATPase subunit